jgi:Zn-dependent protease with chaperone function
MSTQLNSANGASSQFTAAYFDGRSAKKQLVKFQVTDDTVTLQFADQSFTIHPRAAANVLPQIAGAPRRIEFADGAAAITDDHAAVERLFGVIGRETLAHRLESHVGMVVLALMGVAATLILGYFYAVPWGAKEIAMRMPTSVESQMGESAMNGLDQLLFSTTSLNDAQRRAVQDAFDELKKHANLPDAKLYFRSGGRIGANALALPGGAVVITDQLIATMPSIDETSAILAHELGHVKNRHGLRHLLQDAIVAAAAVALYGDVSAITSAAATLPTVLAHNGYSRDFEREADQFSFDLLKATGRSPIAFANALRALEASQVSKDRESTTEKKPSQKVGNYFSTHPATHERALAAETAAAKK